MPAAPPPVGTVENGYRYKGGPPGDQSSWEPVARPSPPPSGESSGWEAVGGRVMPDGSVVRVGPRGGLTVLRPATSTDPAVAKLTEDQAKAYQQAQLQADAERRYQAARARGYDPTSLGSGFAGFVEGIPDWGLLDGFGPVIRGDQADIGRQAEMQWSDAQLRSISGANAPEPETRRNIKTYFPVAGQSLPSIDPNMRQARRTAFEGVRRRAGPLSQDVVAPRDDIGITPEIRARYSTMIREGRVREGKPDGTRQRPYLAADPAIAAKLPNGAFYLDNKLVLRQRGARPAPPRANTGWAAEEIP